MAGLLLMNTCEAQVLTLKQAIDTALEHYPTLKAKANYVRSAQASVEEARREYWPDVSLSGQQDYGTVNGQNGPLYSFEGLTAASSGPNGTAVFAGNSASCAASSADSLGPRRHS